MNTFGDVLFAWRIFSKDRFSDCTEINFLSFIRGNIFLFFQRLQTKMSKKLVKITREDTLARLKEILKDQCGCYVLITCSLPTNDGKMEVEMNFEGDEDLAALLIENASQVFDTRAPRQESK